MSDGSEFNRAVPEEVDKDPQLHIRSCPNCGPHSLGTVVVEDAEYIASCSSCDHEIRAPVVTDENGDHKVNFDAGGA